MEPIEQLERLAAAGFQLLPMGDSTSHFLIERDGYVALVQRKDDGFGQAGSASLLTESGLALLVWQNGQAFWQAKGFRQEATAEQVAQVRKFDEELKRAVGS